MADGRGDPPASEFRPVPGSRENSETRVTKHCGQVAGRFFTLLNFPMGTLFNRVNAEYNAPGEI